ncbi:MAG TPA: hypothetical protein VFW33_16040 [Gemmataceae bacterium]|nr:hypothetical protein [Gemmataceae bacterium]
MFHTLQFRVQYVSDLQRAGKARLERVQVEAGFVLRARVRPWVKETARGPVEVADLDCEGDVLLAVPFAVFQFLEEGE